MKKKINKDGDEVSTPKKINLDYDSKWLCSEVTLLKPDYNISYILKNNKGEVFAVGEESFRLYFIAEKDFLRKEANKKLQNIQLLANQKKEEIYKNEVERKSKEKRIIDCVKLYGQQKGELIAQGKVGLGMTKEMCVTSWGTPLRTSKTIVESGVFENYYYRMGYNLYFENGLLTRIETE